MLLPEDAADDLKEFQSRLDALGTDVEAMLAALSPSAPNLLSPLKRAEALVALAHAVHALNMLHTWCAMGKDPTQVPAVHKEQERLDAYKKKVAKAVAADDLSKCVSTADCSGGHAARSKGHARNVGRTRMHQACSRPHEHQQPVACAPKRAAWCCARSTCTFSDGQKTRPTTFCALAVVGHNSHHPM